MSEQEDKQFKQRQAAWDQLMSMEDVLQVLVSRAATAPNATIRTARKDRRRTSGTSSAGQAKPRVQRRRLSDTLTEA